jgi:ATP-dependent Clp protease ATP-binding subunit ClpC
VDFRNTIVILTSNLGYDSAKRGGGLGFKGSSRATDYEELKRQLIDEAKRVFKPELLNRFDDLIVFRQLDRGDIAAILDLELAKVSARLAQKGKRLTLSKSASEFLIEQGFDPAMGARPMRRALERYLENPLAEEILRGALDEVASVEVVLTGKELSFRQKAGASK